MGNVILCYIPAPEKTYKQLYQYLPEHQNSQ